MKVKNLLICILVMSFIMCPLTVFAAETYDMIITDLTEEEIEEILGNVSFFGTTSTINIARWTKVIDNTKADVNEYSVVYYCPTYEGVVYNNYSTYKYNNQFVTVYYPDGTTWNGTDYRYLKSGSCIEIRTTSLDDTKNILFNDEEDRIEISAKYHITETVYGILGGSYSITYQFNSTNHADTYYIWYNSTFNTNPPLLNNDGTCAVHDYTTITKAATCTEPGGVTYICKECNYSYFEETAATLEHEFEENVCVNCGAEYIPPTDTPDSGGSDGSDISGFLDKLNEIYELLKAYLGMPDVGFIAEIDNILMENLEDNKFFTSVRYIERALTDLYSQDYSSRTGFKELGLTNLHLRRPQQTIYTDFGNEIIGGWNQDTTVYTSEIDWGLESIDVMPMGWFFGQQVGTAGDGTPIYTKGVKAYTDPLISAFLWVSFAFMLWQRLPDIVSGNLATMTAMGGDIIGHEALEEKRVQDELERENARLERELERENKRAAEKTYRESYDYYETNRMRKEQHAARYYEEHKRGKKK